MKVTESIAWVCYESGKRGRSPDVGRFETAVKRPMEKKTVALIKKAVKEEITCRVRHTHPEYFNPNSGDVGFCLICWYSDGSYRQLLGLARFLAGNGFVKRKNGILYDIQFKYERGVTGIRIRLSDLIDLRTGEPKERRE